MDQLAQNHLLMLGIVLFVLFLLLGSGIYIGIGLGLVGMVLFLFFISGNTFKIQGMLQFNIMDSFTLCAVPLFIFMGEVMMRTGAGGKLYQGITPLVSYLPGGLLHTNVASCAFFAALSGSSLATAATIATPAIPELLDKRKYNPQMVLGSLAAGGTLGILIPPSINMIIYGAWTNNSVGTLYIAGIIPGILLTLLFMAYIAIRCSFQPQINPPRESFSLKKILISLPDIIPSLSLMFMVLGTIYLGIATPTESAALGAVGAIVIALISRTLKWESVKESALGTIRTTAMIEVVWVL
jgi:C4-dicarboxylate transporter, DctM subunit